MQVDVIVGICIAIALAWVALSIHMAGEDLANSIDEAAMKLSGQTPPLSKEFTVAQKRAEDRPAGRFEV